MIELLGGNTDVITGGVRGSKHNVGTTLSGPLIEFRVTPKILKISRDFLEFKRFFEISGILQILMDFRDSMKFLRFIGIS